MPTTSLQSLLARHPHRPLILDGGTGSALEDRGVDVRNALWSSAALLSATGREATRALHADYVAAGADVLIANTHNVNPESCRAFVSAAEASKEEPEELLLRLERLGVETALAAVPADREIVVAAGIGSAEPWATSTARSEGEIEAWLAPCVDALKPTGALILFESLSTPPELAAVAGLSRSCGLEAFGIGLTCGPDGRTWGGVTMDETVRAFADTSVAAIFIQCTKHDVAGVALAALVSALGDSEVAPGVYANDGRTWSDMRWHGARIQPEDYARDARAWRDAGARIVGGCCGTAPEHVAALERTLVS
jgi:homocysteine S-methyltransferase